jgi:endo-1,4-beta-xylanase
MDTAGLSGYIGNFEWIRFSPAAAPTKPAPTPAGTTSAFKPLFAIGADECLGSAPASHYVSFLDEGDWLGFKKVDFGTGATKFTASVAVPKDRAGKRLQVRIGSPTGQIVATLTVAPTGGWTTFAAQTTNMVKVTGVHDVFLTFAGGYGIANLDWFKFS